MRLTDEEKAMRDGHDGDAVAAAMDLLIRYGEALGAESLVETRNVCGTVTATTPFMRDFAMAKGGLDAVFSEFNLDTAKVVPVPKVRAFSSHLQLGFDPHHPKEMGVGEAIVEFYRQSEASAARMESDSNHSSVSSNADIGSARMTRNMSRGPSRRRCSPSFASGKPSASEIFGKRGIGVR